jgi:hypothetical protein
VCFLSGFQDVGGTYDEQQLRYISVWGCSMISAMCQQKALAGKPDASRNDVHAAWQDVYQGGKAADVCLSTVGW